MERKQNKLISCQNLEASKRKDFVNIGESLVRMIPEEKGSSSSSKG